MRKAFNGSVRPRKVGKRWWEKVTTEAPCAGVRLRVLYWQFTGRRVAICTYKCDTESTTFYPSAESCVPMSCFFFLGKNLHGGGSGLKLGLRLLLRFKIRYSSK
jgi:hypothetical protein